MNAVQGASVYDPVSFGYHSFIYLLNLISLIFVSLLSPHFSSSRLHLTAYHLHVLMKHYYKGYLLCMLFHFTFVFLQPTIKNRLKLEVSMKEDHKSAQGSTGTRLVGARRKLT